MESGGPHPAEEKGAKSLNGDIATSITFVNTSGQPIRIYWLDYQGRRVLYARVEHGGGWGCDQTYLTHPWLITNDQDQAWALYYPDAQHRTIEIASPHKQMPPAALDAF